MVRINYDDTAKDVVDKINAELNKSGIKLNKTGTGDGFATFIVEGFRKHTSYQRSSSSYGETIVEIYVTPPGDRKLEREEVNVIGKATDQIMHIVSKTSMGMHPDIINEINEERVKLIELFGDRAIFVEELPNGYYPDSEYFGHFPWFKVTTRVGRIIIGWRKRVINIDWSESLLRTTAKELFPDEDVTKFDQTIHAWGYEKAKEYLERILATENQLA